MTRTKLLGALAVLVITVGVVSFIPHSQGKNNEGSKSIIEAVGLPEYGLEIIGPKQPSFSKYMATEKKSVSETPFSVFLVNENDQALAACTLKWEVLMRDGRTVTHLRSKTGRLNETFSNNGQTYLAVGVAARGHLLFSLTNGSGIDNQAPQFNTGGGGSNIAAQLSDSVKVTVSVDGVLFVDGTYAGPDSKNYFDRSQGQIEANRELATEVDQLITTRANPEDVMKYLAKVAQARSDDVQIPPDKTPEYCFGKWMEKTSYARLLLALGKAKGNQAIIDRVQAELSKPQIKLRRLKQS